LVQTRSQRKNRVHKLLEIPEVAILFRTHGAKSNCYP
jgi:hypothetical protein